MRDLGTRNAKGLYPLRIERINWPKHLIRIPDSKTKAGERPVPMSHRAGGILHRRCGDRNEGWVFPSRQNGKHITNGLVNKRWVRTRRPGSPMTLSLRAPNLPPYISPTLAPDVKSPGERGVLRS
jgi:hypothetical protein